jgi:glycosyltransferase involved in cell wall biosynthesis
MKEYPRYSVLMSVYAKERAEWLREAIDSMLHQTVPPSEIVLVEDGPLTEALYNVISEYTKNSLFKIIVLKENVGLGLALQEGIKHCSNNLIARMDTDDISTPDRCEKEIQKFIEDPSLDIVGCWENEFWNTTEKKFSCHIVPEKHKDIIEFMHYRCALLHPTVIFKKDAVLRAGNYQDRKLFEDYDLFVRMLQTKSKAYNLQEPLYFLRVNPTLFKRRGGFKYALTVLKFKYQLWRNGFFSFSNFILSGIGHCCVCLIPNWLRIIFYKSFLR